MGIDCRSVFGRGAAGVESECVGLLYRIAVPEVTYEGVGVMRAVPQIFFGDEPFGNVAPVARFDQACATRLDLDAKAVLFIMRYP